MRDVENTATGHERQRPRHVRPGERLPGALGLLACLTAASGLVVPSLFVVSAGLVLAAAEPLAWREHKGEADKTRRRRRAASVRIGFAALALIVGLLPRLLSRLGLDRSLAPLPAPPILALTGAVLIGGAFMGLIAERRLSALAARAASLQALRIALAAAALVGASLLAGAGEVPAASWLRAAAGLVVLGLALERLALGVLALILPAASGGPAADDLPKLGLGIDLSRSWALRFTRAILPAIVAALAVVMWLSAGVMVLGPGERAVARRFGATVGVLGPGLHVGLPPPFGSVARVENGLLHEVTLGDARQEGQSATAVGADADAPAALDRLWTASHPGEIALLIASGTAERPTVETVDVDLTLVWRIGLTDGAALAAVSAVSDPEAVVRVAARRDVARLFTGQNLDAVIGADRAAIESRLRRDVQADLDRLGTGIETVAVVVEGAHPPPGAAAAYHGVQVAGILADRALENARAQAVAVLGQARQEADKTVTEAQSTQAETLAAARGDAASFQAARAASVTAGAAFALEARFEHLAGSLPRSRVLVIDHRLEARQLPSIDLRPPAIPPDAPPPSEE